MQQSAQNVLADEQQTEQSFVQQQSHLELFHKPQAKRKKSLVSEETRENKTDKPENKITNQEISSKSYEGHKSPTLSLRWCR